MIRWALSLLLLAFVCKLSLAFLGMPAQVPGLIFQHGLHPYLNIVLNFLLGLPVVLYGIRHGQEFEKLTRIYKTLVVLLLVLLLVETFLQFIFLESHKGYYAWAAYISTFWLIFVFGLVLPALVEPAKALRFLSSWSLVFVVISLILWLIRPDLTFKGGRFVGVFKHIPYMVTCSSIGMIFTLGRFHMEKGRFKKGLLALGILLSLVALLLTGTRSALAAVIMAVVLWVLRAPTRSPSFRFFKYSAALVITVTVLLFGMQMMDYAADIATGKRSLVEREAQDGVASRLEEVARGWEYFQTSPWIGQGLLSKFSGKDSLEVTSYNSFKDPHNIFASAGVVGGWPFIVWTAVFVVLILIFSLKAVLSDSPVIQVFGIYAVVQIPILIIYHWHLSLGGMADRFYWLVFGYIALHTVQKKISADSPKTS